MNDTLMSPDGFDVGPDPDGEIGALAAIDEDGLYGQLLDRAARLGTARAALTVIRDLARERIHRAHGHGAAWTDVLRACNVGLGEEGGS